CPHPACFHRYRVGNQSWPEAFGEKDEEFGAFMPLGCTRLRAEALVALRVLADDPTFTETWVSRDPPMNAVLDAAGITKHRHPEMLVHHHDYSMRASDTPF
ncbi:MAG TPA: hypothetical protein VK386_00340, partial [Acidimicrobiales bacterium]|nr:hypothetical protein [Acidimicrobiales bacterium]